MRIGRRPTGVDIGIDGVSGASLIGQGGFGVVYRAEHRALGRTVAIKILSAPGFDDDTRARFERECEAIDALAGHEHVVAILDSGINEWGRPYLVMEHMARGSIADRIVASGPLAWPTAVELAVKIAGAVSASHAAGILHRDIKPQNILLSAYDEPKLGDFGIAAIAAEQTNSGSIAASLEHAAPELLNGGRASAASDVYALASSLFTMVAGRSPFSRRSDETIAAIVARIATQPVPDLRPKGVPGALADILERGLAKDPADRFGTADEFAAALTELLEHHGVAPAPAVTSDHAAMRERMVPSVTSMTGPTRPRLKREITEAPAPKGSSRRGRVLLTATLTVLLAVAGTAVAVRRTQTPPAPRAAQQPVTTSVPVAAADPAPERDESRAEDRRHRRTKKPRRNAQDTPPKVSYGSGTTIAAAPPVPETSGGTSPTRTQKSRDRSTEQRPEPEPAPPAPDLTLFHAYKEHRHSMFTDPGLKDGFQDEGFKIEVVGGVYSYQEEGTRPISVSGTTLYSFTSSRGETSPQTERALLYYMASSEEDDFYTASEGLKSFYYSRGWAVQRQGWVAR